MFSKYSMTFALFGAGQAINTHREPLLTWEPTNAKSHPMNYPVPSFGADPDMANTKTNLANSESKLSHTWIVSKKDLDKKPAYPTDYYVPNFGQDTDVKNSLGHLSAAETNLKHKWNVAPKKLRAKPWPVDYFVPHFGQDPDVIDTKTSLSTTEKRMNHTWIVKPKDLKKKDGHPVDYFVPNFGLDADVKNSLGHAKAAEKSLNKKWVIDDADIQLESFQQASYKNGVWMLPKDTQNVQVEQSREPLLTWKQTPKASHPMDYVVQNYGADPDMEYTRANMLAEEKRQSYTWIPKKDDNDKWVVPTATVEFRLREGENAGNFNFVQREDIQNVLLNEAREPLMTWEPKEPASHPVDYVVPDFGVDGEMQYT